MTGKIRKSALALMLGVCCASAFAQAKTEITLQRFFGACEADYGKVVDVTKARGECGIITSLVNQFNATNTQGIVVKPQIAEWGPYYDQLTARIVAKDIPTIAVMHESVLGDFVSRKLVEPLDEGFKSVGINTADFTEQASKGTTIDGKTYALPQDTWSWLWHINLNLFKKAGLKMPAEPSWDQVRRFAEKMDDPKSGMSGICLRGLAGWGEVLAPLDTVINTFGGRWFDLDWNATLDSPESKEAINFYIDTVRQYGTPGAAQTSFAECATQYTQGNAAMWYDAPPRSAPLSPRPTRRWSARTATCRRPPRRPSIRAGCTPGHWASRRRRRMWTRPGSSCPG